MKAPSKEILHKAGKFILVGLFAAFCISWAPRPVKWVAIGDSITYLNDHLNETGNRLQKGYMTRAIEMLPNITYINKGFNGWTSTGIAEKIDQLGLEKADVYSVFLGTNDWWSGQPTGEFSDYTNNTGHKTVYGAFRIIVDKLRSLNPQARIILMTPMQRGDFVYWEHFRNNAYGSYRAKNGQQLADIAAAIKKIALHEKLPLVDIYHESGITPKNAVKFKRLKDSATGQYKNYSYPKYIDVPFNPDTDEYPYPVEAVDMTYDGLHPSDKGNEIIANMLVRELKNCKTTDIQEEVFLYPEKQATEKASITVFLPEAGNNSGKAVIICPGGAYGGLVFDREGTRVAKAFNKAGIAAFVLRYRLPDKTKNTDQSTYPLQDAQTAVKIIRQRADEWGIVSNKIGIMGFSAGGHLAATAGTHFSRPVIDNPENVNLRPDFMILVYPVISFTDAIGHLGSRENLLGTATPSQEKILLYSNELWVDKTTPPAFITHANDDSAVPVANSLVFYEALSKNGIPSEIHIYEKGEHGYLSKPPFDEWFGRCLYWLGER
ncbi:MAG: GDSL-type esterase/lipase family protein [Bacteroidales bacterium]|jgi:acetyl esterase/lipase/lysophospholipase L1-like esterase|nr:GDSL-type esterase/lipase family protein [Bacteroidales bacterium]